MVTSSNPYPLAWARSTNDRARPRSLRHVELEPQVAVAACAEILDGGGPYRGQGIGDVVLFAAAATATSPRGASSWCSQWGTAPGERHSGGHRRRECLGRSYSRLAGPEVRTAIAANAARFSDTVTSSSAPPSM